MESAKEVKWNRSIFKDTIQENISKIKSCCCCCQVASVVSDSVRSHRWKPTRLLRPWDSPGKNTGVGCHFLLQCMKVKSEREVTQRCPTLSDLMDSSLPGSDAHGIFQARVLEWGAMPSPQASLSISNSQSLLKLMSLELVMPSNHLILCSPLLLPLSISSTVGQ